jgi:hypothetical protein
MAWSSRSIRSARLPITHLMVRCPSLALKCWSRSMVATADRAHIRVQHLLDLTSPRPGIARPCEVLGRTHPTVRSGC